MKPTFTAKPGLLISKTLMPMMLFPKAISDAKDNADQRDHRNLTESRSATTKLAPDNELIELEQFYISY
jgi:hypothetical protein